MTHNVYVNYTREVCNYRERISAKAKEVRDELLNLADYSPDCKPYVKDCFKHITRGAWSSGLEVYTKSSITELSELENFVDGLALQAVDYTVRLWKDLGKVYVTTRLKEAPHCCDRPKEGPLQGSRPLIDMLADSLHVSRKY